MNKIKFHKVAFEKDQVYAYFYIDNLTDREFLKKQSLFDVKNMIICSETIKAYNAIDDFHRNLNQVFR